MANGFNYESPLNRLLSVTLPQFISQQTAMARDERNRIRQEERADKRYLQEFNRNETRYQDGLRRQTELDNRDFDSNLINQGSSITNLQSQKDYYTTLLKSGNLKSTAGYDLSEARVTALGSGIDNANKNVKMLGDMGIEEYYVNRAKDFYMQGNDVAAFNVIDTQLKYKFKNPQILKQAQLYMSDIESYNTQLGKLIGLNTPEVKAERQRIEGLKNKTTNQFRKLYELAIPFDPEGIRTDFAISIQKAIIDSGAEVDDNDFSKYFGNDGKYSNQVDAFENKFVYGSKAESFSQEEVQKEISKIVSQIKSGESKELPTEDTKFEDLVPGVGTIGGLYVGWQLSKKPREYLSNKIGQAAKYTKWVTKLPNEDVGKFLELVSKKSPGQVGTMMPKIEKLISRIDEITLEGGRGYKKKVAEKKKELDSQIKKVKKVLKSKGISSKIKDADLEKLIRNPSKWFLPKVKAQMISAKGASAKMARGWGAFRIAQEAGKALGDPTEGVATGITAGAAAKGIKTIADKKGKKWVYNKALKVFGKSAAKRIATSAAAGSLFPGVGTAAGTIAGTAITIYDIYNALTEDEEE